MEGSEPIDRQNAFLLYAAFTGDIERTAFALGVSPVSILKVSEDEGWAAKLRPILELKKSERPGDTERALNRALNFVQAHKMRLFLERVLNLLTGLDDEQIRSYVLKPTTPRPVGRPKKGDDPPTVTLTSASGIKVDARPFADLASALEKAHALTYMALGDTASERVKMPQDASKGGEAASDIHARIAAAMQAAGASSGPRALLLDAQLATAAKLSAAAAKPEHPADNDDH